MPLTPAENILFKLLQAALWETTPAEADFHDHSYDTWYKVHQLALHHGVLPLALDGISRLPLACHPPQEIKYVWIAYTRVAESRNQHAAETARKLNTLFQSQDISMMILKGIGLASCYPIPTHRESGDIDIWLHGKFAEGNQLITQQGIAVERTSSKHSTFEFNEMMIENHATFLSTRKSAIDRQLEERLHHLLQAESPEQLPLDETTSIQLPPSTFNAAFILRHMSVHLPDGQFSLRHLCDWACFLHTHSGKLNHQLLAETFQGTVMERLLPIYTHYAVAYLGLPPQHAPANMASLDTELAERILQDTLRSPYRIQPEEQTLLSAFVWKSKRYINIRWKHHLIFGSTVPTQMLNTCIKCLKNPRVLYRRIDLQSLQES